MYDDGRLIAPTIPHPDYIAISEGRYIKISTSILVMPISSTFDPSQGPSLCPDPMNVIGIPCSLKPTAEFGVEVGSTPYRPNVF